MVSNSYEKTFLAWVLPSYMIGMKLRSLVDATHNMFEFE